MDEHLMKSLARRLSLTDLEDEKEKYILTPEDEGKVIHHHIKRARDHEEWKLNNLEDGGVISKEEIEKRLSLINWEEKIDRSKILKAANSTKLQEAWHKEQREKEIELEVEKQKQLKDSWTARTIYSLMKYTAATTYGKTLIVNEQTLKLITTICYFLSEDPRFEADLGYSLKKGLLIRGIAGLGKTFLLKCAADNGLNPVQIISMIEITNELRSTGEFVVEMDGRKVLYLDDVGTEEPVVVFYGTRISFFKNYIEVYYLRNKAYRDLIISTNNSFDELEEKYGFRVRSRIKDIFNIIDVTGTDMRGLK